MLGIHSIALPSILVNMGAKKTLRILQKRGGRGHLRRLFEIGS